MIANTPKPPYYAVIFTTQRTTIDEGYAEMAQQMLELAQQQPGFLGEESARDGLGITVSYWESLEAIKNWKNNAKHLQAQKLGKEKWYKKYKLRVAVVERDAEF
ncbi:antibiotic biosynthesis monooxygenase family protein [Draconibacterium sediminis]|uniref:JEMB protein n=1 Tax=Draconibacterium sediminis TaxID=1544798 RepID=A0A0D8J6M6_9BACT|nr:antibiotic biosynthesis monooxygenase [Draconibacterium sediminis]KJF42547.1 JEMB protein [Draconibacterium sediminis]